MEYVVTVFILGLMISLLVAEGISMAQEFTAEELERTEREKLAGNREE